MAAPAIPPTTPPTTVDVDGVEEESELVPFPAAAVVVDALPVAPVPPPGAPIPDVGVALESDEE